MFKLNRIKIFIVVSCISMQLHGAYSVLSNIQEQIENLQQQVKELEQKTQLDKSGAKLPGGLPNMKNPQGFSFELDILYFKTLVSGTAFAYSSAYPAQDSPITASIQDLGYSMDWGLRAAVERLIVNEDWSIKFEYSHLRSIGSRSSEGLADEQQLPLKGILIIDDGVDYAKSNGSVQWNDFLLNLNKSFFINRRFSLETSVGLRGTILEIKQWTRYTGGDLGIHTDHVGERCKFEGIGPDFSQKASFFLNKNFSFTGLIDLGLEYGISKVIYRENKTDEPDDSILFSQTKHLFSPIIDTSLDLNYGFYFKEQRGYMNVFVGYEAVLLMRQNQLFQLIGTRASRISNVSEDVSFHGIKAGLKVLF